MHTVAIVTGVIAMSLAPDARGEEWSLATSDTAIRIAVREDRPVITHLACPGTAHDWSDPGGMAVPLMSRVWVGRREAAPLWRFARASRSRRQGTLTLAFRSGEPALELRSIWQARPGRGPVEHWMELVNTSGAAVTVSHQDSLTLAHLAVGAPADLWWFRRGGSNASTQGGTFTEPVGTATNLTLASNCEDGASPVPWLAVQSGAERGLYVGWEFSALGRVRARAADGGLAIDVGLLPDFKTDVAPGETFLVPPAFVGCYRGDIDEGAHSLHRFIVEKLRPRVAGRRPDPILTYNLYLDAGGNRATEGDVLRSARVCRDSGFEAFMPDAMWFPETGDWRWDPTRFPNGAAPIEEFVHKNGMAMALWCAWTNGGVSPHPDALSIRGPVAHPEWFRADVAPDWSPGPFHGAQLCLGCPEAREWAAAKTQWLVSHHKLDYLKHDIGPIVTTCERTGHRHRYGVDASYWATMGYYDVQERVRAAFPSLILENCSGGGHIKDFGVVKRTHYTVTTDTLSNLPDRQSLWDSTLAFPPLLLQAYTYDSFYQVPGDEPDAFLWRSAMMGAWQIDPTNTLAWTEQTADCVRRHARIYKDWIRPMLRDVKVHHVLRRPDGKNWDGLFYWSAARRRGMLFLFRPDSPADTFTVRLRGLEPAKRYWVWSEDGSVSPGERSGAELMATGLTPRLPARYTSDLVYVRDAAAGRPAGVGAPGPFRALAPSVQADAYSASVTLRWTPSARARCYRVAISETPGFEQPLRTATAYGASATFADLPAGRRLHWRVEAAGWGGTRVCDSGPGEVSVPDRKPLPGVTFVSDMPWVSATAGADNPVRRDANYWGRRISVGGKQRPKGVWTHAYPDETPADTVIGIAGSGFALFATDAGVEDASGGGSVRFAVLADGRLLAESPVLLPGQVHRFRVDVTGAKQVTLRVTNGGDGYTCDHAAWAMARFVAAGVADPVE